MCVCVCISANDSLNSSAITVLLRTICGVSIVPLEYICVVALCIVVVNPIVFGMKIASMKHPKTNEVLRVSLGQITVVPKQLILDERVKMDIDRVNKLFNLTCGFAFMYVSTPRVFILRTTHDHSVSEDDLWSLDYSFRIYLCHCAVHRSCKSNCFRYENSISETPENK